METFGSAKSSKTCGNIFRGCGGLTRRLGFGVGRTVADWFDPNIHRGIVAIEKSRIGLIMFLRLADELGEELEHGRGSNIGRVLVSEFHELVIEGGHHPIREASHDVVDQAWREGNVVEVVHGVEFLDDLQVGQ